MKITSPENINGIGIRYLLPFKITSSDGAECSKLVSGSGEVKDNQGELELHWKSGPFNGIWPLRHWAKIRIHQSKESGIATLCFPSDQIHYYFNAAINYEDGPPPSIECDELASTRGIRIYGREFWLVADPPPKDPECYVDILDRWVAILNNEGKDNGWNFKVDDVDRKENGVQGLCERGLHAH